MFWNKEKSLVDKAKEANLILDALGVEAHTESGKQLRSAIAMELLGQKYDMMDKHGKASFVKQNKDVLIDVKEMLVNEGVLSKPAVGYKEDKKK